MKRISFKTVVMAAGLGLALTSGQPARTSQDHEQARHALQSGEILPLEKILAIVSTQQPGKLLEVELENEHIQGKRKWIYEIKGITADGRIFRMKVDARTGEVIRSRSQPHD